MTRAALFVTVIAMAGGAFTASLFWGFESLFAATHREIANAFFWIFVAWFLLRRAEKLRWGP